MDICREEEGVLVGCGFRPSPITADDVSLWDISDSTPVKLPLRQTGNNPIFTILSYTSKATGDRSYRCTATSYSLSVEVTIHFIEPAGKVL